MGKASVQSPAVLEKKLFCDTFAGLASKKVSPGQVVKVKCHSSGAKGGGDFLAEAGTWVSDGGTRTPSGTAGVRLTRILSGPVTVEHFGGVGAGDETAVISLCESSSYTTIDLCGYTITTTLTASALTKKYVNGTLLASNSVIVKNKDRKRLEELDITSGSKCRVLSWSGKKLLWLGTSIPAQGGLGTYIYGAQANGDSYPFLFGASMGCDCKNFAWAQSHAFFNKNANAFTGSPVNALSMTDDDRVALLAQYGGASDYSDTINAITKPSEMTCDFRIKAQFVAGQIDVVFLDHNHNDQSQLPGTLSPETLTITSITKGTTTSITLSAIGTLAVGDGVALDSIVGISKLNYAAARVQSVVGNVITLNIDSSGFSGAFASGSLKKLDRNTIYGAWEFLIYYIKNMSLRYNSGVVDIILCGAPSEYTNNVATPQIYSISRYIKDVADKWGLSYYDIASDLKIQQADHSYYLPDNVHPTTLDARKVIAAHWVSWASGGMVLKPDPLAYLPCANQSFVDNRDAVYSKFAGGFSTAQRYVAAPVTLWTETFANLASWTQGGAATCVVTAAPWGAGNAVKMPVTGASTTAWIRRTGAFTEGMAVTFDLYISSAALVSGSTVAIVGVFTLGNASGDHYAIDIIATSAGLQWRVSYYTGNGGTGFTSFAPISNFAAGVKRTIEIQAIRKIGSDNGAILIYLDGSATPFTMPYQTSDSVHANDTDLIIGPRFNNTGATFDLYYGNVVAKKIDVKDTSTRFTGTFVAGAQTVTVVNGIITTVV